VQQLPFKDSDYAGLAHIIRRLRFLRLMKGEGFERMLARIVLCSYEAGETIFHKGDPPTAFYLIYTGKVRIHLGYRFIGLMKRMAHLGPGDLFGERAILEKKLRTATAVAEEPTQLFVLTYEQFDELMREDPDFAALIKFAVASRR
jgi:CRP/FNR family transcriptional regulator, cyclic AMP receptor protein